MIKIPPFEKFSVWYQGFGLFVSGVIVGCALYLGMTTRHVETLHDKLTAQDRQIQSMQNELNALNKTKNRPTAISKIHVTLLPRENEPAIDEMLKNELEKAVENKLKVFLGLPSSDLANPLRQEILKELVNQKFLIREEDYTVTLHSIVLVQTELSVSIYAKRYIKPTIWPFGTDE